MRVTAKATRTDGWWAVEVPEVPGVFTQARRLDQIPEMVADAVALVADVDATSVDVSVEPHTDFDRAIAEVKGARRQAEEAAERASALVRVLVRDMVAQDVTVRDAGELLGVSPQRVSQLAK